MPDHKRASSSQYYQEYGNLQTPTSAIRAVVSNTSNAVTTQDLPQEYDHHNSYSNGKKKFIYWLVGFNL